jgi:hypothetical protein
MLSFAACSNCFTVASLPALRALRSGVARSAFLRAPIAMKYHSLLFFETKKVPRLSPYYASICIGD